MNKCEFPLFFFHCRSSLAWTQKEPEACLCIRCRQKEGGTQWARRPACLFLLVFLLSFLILSHPSPPTPTPPPHTHILVSWRLNPEGRDLLSHTRTWVPRAQGESQWLLFSLCRLPSWHRRQPQLQKCTAEQIY